MLHKRKDRQIGIDAIDLQKYKFREMLYESGTKSSHLIF